MHPSAVCRARAWAAKIATVYPSDKLSKISIRPSGDTLATVGIETAKALYSAVTGAPALNLEGWDALVSEVKNEVVDGGIGIVQDKILSQEESPVGHESEDFLRSHLLLVTVQLRYLQVRAALLGVLESPVLAASPKSKVALQTVLNNPSTHAR